MKCRALQILFNTMSKEDRYELHLMNTSKRFVDRHYQVRLPWKPGCPLLPEQSPASINAFILFEAKIGKGSSQVFCSYYGVFVESYMHKVDDNEN